jgi:hypothetical protein
LATGQRGKVEKIKNPAIFLATYCPNMATSELFFSQNLATLVQIFHKNPFYELHWISPPKKIKHSSEQCLTVIEEIVNSTILFI